MKAPGGEQASEHQMRVRESSTLTEITRMASRDLTTNFLNHRRSLIRRRGSHGGANIAEEGYDTQPLHPASRAPGYMTLVDEVKQHISEITSMMSRLEEMQNERLRATLATSMEQQEMAIESLTANITNRFSRAGSALKLIASSRQREGVHSADDNVRLNIQRSLAAKLHQKSNAFRAMQKRYLSKMKELKEGSGWDSLVGTASSGAAGANEVDLGFSQAQVQEVDDMEQFAQERDEEVRKIVESINQLAEIFKELNVLVVEQGTLLDRIDYNMDLTVERTKQGVDHLRTAETYQKSARPLKCIGVLLALIVIMVIILVVRKT